MKIADEVYKGITTRRRKRVFDMIFDNVSTDDQPSSWLDVGCATGDLIYFASQLYVDTMFYGVDISEALIDTAEESLKGEKLNFRVGDFFTDTQGEHDVVTALAVSGYHASEAAFLKPLIESVSPKGKLFIHGLFNPYGLTVELRWRKNGTWQYGLNQLSLEKSVGYLTERGFTVQVTPVEINETIPFNPKFPHRAYSITHEKFYLANGCMMILPDYILQCERCD